MPSRKARAGAAQLEFAFGSTEILSLGPSGVSPDTAWRQEPAGKMSAGPTAETAVPREGRLATSFVPGLGGADSIVAGIIDAGAGISDPGYNDMAAELVGLENQARELLRIHGAARIAAEVRVEWNPRLTTCAGRADYCNKLISLNPCLREHGEEVGRTLLHELAHLLAQFRAGRRRIRPHGREWRKACADLGIADEKRCHNLPFPTRERRRGFLYQCPNCARDFPRVRKIRRAIACLACCRKHNGGEFDSRFRLRLVSRQD